MYHVYRARYSAPLDTSHFLNSFADHKLRVTVVATIPEGADAYTMIVRTWDPRDEGAAAKVHTDVAQQFDEPAIDIGAEGEAAETV